MGLASLAVSDRLLALAQVPVDASQFENPWLNTNVLVAIGVLVAIAVTLVLISYLTRAGIIARATTKETIRQPVFILLAVIGCLLTVVNAYVPFYTFGEDTKMLLDCGYATMLTCGLLLGVWTSSTSIADEIEGRTAMTLLSKPITRRQFIFGKYVGILNAVYLLLIPIAATLFAMVYMKVGQEADPNALQLLPIKRIAVATSILPAAVVIFLQITVLSALSVAISTRLPMVVNIVLTFAIFIVANLTPVLIREGVDNEFVAFFGRLLAAVLPSLESFGTQASVATNAYIGPEVLFWLMGYSICYAAFLMLGSFILFEDRDLA